MTQKYCYIIVDKENGRVLLDDVKLPFYWHKEYAKETQAMFGNKYVVHKLEIADIEALILKSKPI